MNIDKILEIANKIAPDLSIVEYRGQYTLTIADKYQIIPLLKELKANAKFDMLTDITAIDWARKEQRFELVYFLYSTENNERLRLSTPIEESDCTAPTVENVYPSANWYEREVWDMYGIKFDDHSDMRRFYMPEDFFDKETGEQYHPLRKDFPLMGIPNSLPLPPFPEKTGVETKF